MIKPNSTFIVLQFFSYKFNQKFTILCFSNYSPFPLQLKFKLLLLLLLYKQNCWYKCNGDSNKILVDVLHSLNKIFSNIEVSVVKPRLKNSFRRVLIIVNTLCIYRHLLPVALCIMIVPRLSAFCNSMLFNSNAFFALLLNNKFPVFYIYTTKYFVFQIFRFTTRQTLLYIHSIQVERVGHGVPGRSKIQY